MPPTHIAAFRPEPSKPFPTNVPILTRAGLMGTWHVVSSSLSLWKNKRNVTITYSDVGGDESTNATRSEDAPVDDLVQFECDDKEPGDATRHAVHGIDKSDTPKTGTGKDDDESKTASSSGGGGGGGGSGSLRSGLQYEWRGKGLLKVASSKWQVIAYGGDDVEVEGGKVQSEVQWIVIFFEATLFTSSGMDILVKSGNFVSNVLSEQRFKEINDGLKNMGKEIGEQREKLFDVPIVDDSSEEKK